MIHHLTVDRVWLGQRFLTCGCGHGTTGAIADKTAELDMEVHFRRVRTEHLALIAFRRDCSAVHNGPLASLATDAITGDPAALIRVTAIMAGGEDPGEAAAAAQLEDAES